MSVCLVWWAIEFNEFDIQYKPRPAIKSQVLVDFIAECTIPPERAFNPPDATVAHESILLAWPWILHVDGSSTLSTTGAGLILSSPDGEVIEYALRFSIFASNNKAKYEALIRSLKLAKKLNVLELRVFSDLQLVVGQVRREIEARTPAIISYLNKAREIKSQIPIGDLL